MPRHARLELPNVPLHIIQRGVNRCAVFIDADDRRHYLRLLRRAAQTYDISLHAYVLMGNHVHLLATSQAVGAISDAMRWSGQCYVQAFNRRHRRTGTLWEGRFKSCLVDSNAYLLEVYRYIELNPVRAALVDSPECYPWSSVRGNLGFWSDPVLTPHPVFLAFTRGDSRARTYREWLAQGTCDDDLESIRAYLQQEKALGSSRFRDMVGRTFNREVSWRACGRPRRDS
jgi:REP-associated tyrosine transposase